MRNTVESRKLSKYGHDVIAGTLFSKDEIGSYTKDGKEEPRLRFVVAVDVTDESGDVPGSKVKDKWKSIFYSCTAFGSRAKYISENINQGDVIVVKGKEEFKDEKYFNMTVNSVQKLTARNVEGQEASKAKTNGKASAPVKPAQASDIVEENFADDDDVPF